MEFLLYALIGLTLLGLASLAVVEGGYLLGRMYSRLSFWCRYRYLFWSSARQVRALKRRYGRRDTSRPFGSLRFTRSRYEELSAGTDEAENE